MENRTTNKKSIAISFAAIFLLNIILTVISNVIVMSGFRGSYDTTAESALASYQSSFLIDIANLAVNIITIGIIILLGKKLTSNKIRTILFLGCYYFGSDVGALFSSLVSNVFQYLMRSAILPTTASTIMNISSILCLVPAAFAAYMAFTAFEGINGKIPAHPVNVSLSKARSLFIITVVITALFGGAIVSIPNLLIALINPESGSFASEALIFSGYLVKWLSNVISFSVIYIAGYRTTKSHFGAISFYLPAESLAVPATVIIGNISSIAVDALRYVSQLKLLEAAEPDYSMIANNSYATTIVASIIGLISVIIGFIIGYKALGLFYTNEIVYENHVAPQTYPEAPAESDTL